MRMASRSVAAAGAQRTQALCADGSDNTQALVTRCDTALLGRHWAIRPLPWGGLLVTGFLLMWVRNDQHQGQSYPGHGMPPCRRHTGTGTIQSRNRPERDTVGVTGIHGWSAAETASSDHPQVSTKSLAGGGESMGTAILRCATPVRRRP